MHLNFVFSYQYIDYFLQDLYNLTSGKLVVLQHCRADDNNRCFMYDKDLESLSECEFQAADIWGEFLERRISFRIQNVITMLLGKDQNGMLMLPYLVFR